MWELMRCLLKAWTYFVDIAVQVNEELEEIAHVKYYKVDNLQEMSRLSNTKIGLSLHILF